MYWFPYFLRFSKRPRLKLGKLSPPKAAAIFDVVVACEARCWLFTIPLSHALLFLRIPKDSEVLWRQWSDAFNAWPSSTWAPNKAERLRAGYRSKWSHGMYVIKLDAVATTKIPPVIFKCFYFWCRWSGNYKQGKITEHALTTLKTGQRQVIHKSTPVCHFIHLCFCAVFEVVNLCS